MHLVFNGRRAESKQVLFIFSLLVSGAWTSDGGEKQDGLYNTYTFQVLALWNKGHVSPEHVSIQSTLLHFNLTALLTCLLTRS